MKKRGNEKKEQNKFRAGFLYISENSSEKVRWMIMNLHTGANHVNRSWNYLQKYQDMWYRQKADPKTT